MSRLWANPYSVGARLKKRRIELAMSQGDLADLLGVHVMTVSQWERGTALPDTSNWLALVLTTGRPFEWYMTVQLFTLQDAEGAGSEGSTAGVCPVVPQSLGGVSRGEHEPPTRPLSVLDPTKGAEHE